MPSGKPSIGGSRLPLGSFETVPVDVSNPVAADALFVSPHLDDVALSCGGTVALEARRGGALVVTVFAGRPGEALNAFARFQHERWGHLDDAVGERRREDAAAMAVLGARFTWLEFPDAIYRGNLYLSDDELFGPVKSEDAPIADGIIETLGGLIRSVRPSRIYLPLGAGEHVDHQICSALEARLRTLGLDVLFYEDFPYAATPDAVEKRVARWMDRLRPLVVSIGETIETRLAAIRCYRSQLSTIFRHYGQPDDVVREFARSVGAGDYAERFWQIAQEEP